MPCPNGTIAGGGQPHGAQRAQTHRRFPKRISGFQSPNTCADYELIEAMAHAIEVLRDALEDKQASIRRLLPYLLGASTETKKNLFPKKDAETLKPGDRCPQCQRGNLYELAPPAVTLQLEGRPPVSGTIYECQRLRCSACGAVDTAQPPKEVGEVKESESVIAIVVLPKDGCGVPIPRAELLRPLFEALMDCPAQGKLLHKDDTTMRILNYLNEGDPDETTRKGIFTSGIISMGENRKIALFMTGRRHAGENSRSFFCERALKHVVLHRKNAYFFKTPKGAHVGDLFMSLIHTCELGGESPMDELCAVLKNAARVATDPMAWMPWNYRHNLTKEPP